MRIDQWTRLRARLHATPVAAAAALLCALSAPVQAQQSSAIIDELLDKLKDKGVLSQEEYDALKQAREEEKTEQRSVRRKQALKSAQDEDKKEKAAEAAKTTVTGRFKDGVTFETGDRTAAISLGGRIHADYRSYANSDATADTFDLRRAYLTVTGKIYDYVTFDLTGDFANQVNNSQLDVAWINVAPWKEAQFRIGQFKMPFSLEELGSSRFLDFQERSLVNGLVPQKERGMMVWGVPVTGVTYGLALSTGQGKNNNDTVAVKADNDLIGRVAANAAEWIGNKDMVLHFGGAFSHGTLPTNFTLSQRTEGRGITFFNSTAFNGTEIRRDRLGFESSLAWGPVKLQGEWVRANYEGSSAAGAPIDKNIDAYYVEALWLLTGEKYADTYRNGVYGRISPKANFTLGGPGWGAVELGLRYSQYDAGDFASGAAGTGTLGSQAATANQPFTVTSTAKATATTVGLKWILNPNFKFYLNYVRTEFDTPVVVRPNYGGLPDVRLNTEHAVTLRAALDF